MASIAFVLAIATWLAPPSLGNAPDLVASWAAADGRVWVISARGRTWQRVPGLADAAVAEVFQGRVLVVRRTGIVSVWTGSGPQWQNLAGVADVRDLSCGSLRCLAQLAGGGLMALDGDLEPLPVPWEGEATSISVAGERALVATESGAVLEWTGPLDGEPRRIDVEDASLVAATPGAGYSLSRAGEVLAWTSTGTPSPIDGVEARRIVRGPGGGAIAITVDGRLLRLGRTPAAVANTADWVWAWSSGDVTLALDDQDGLTLLSSSGTTRYQAATFRTAQPEPGWQSPAPFDSPLRASVLVGPVATDLDALVAKRLEEAGFETTVVQQEGTWDDADLLVVSSSVVASDLSRSFGQASLPMVVLDAAVLGRLGLVAPGPRSFGLTPGTAAVGIRPHHPLGSRGSGRVVVAGSASWLPHVQPRNGLITVVSEAGLGVVFGWEAPHRRAGLLLAASHLTAPAWDLFDEAVRWAVGESRGPEREWAGRAQGSRRGGAGSEFVATQSLTGGTGTVLLVVGNLTLSTYDATLKSMIEAMGFTVVTKLASAAGASDATGKVLVFVSGSSPNGDILTKFLNVTVPVLIQTPGIVDDMLMASATDRGSDAAASKVTILDPNHAIAHPLAGSVTVSGSAVQNWGVGSASSQSVAATNASSGHHADGFQQLRTPAA